MALTNGVTASNDMLASEHASNEPLTSPYTTRAVTIKIGPNGKEYTAFEAMVQRYPGLHARMKNQKIGAPIELPEIDEDVGHTFVHFLYTSEYNTLALGEIPENVRATAEFKRSILAYCAARLCIMDLLEKITREKMEYYSQHLTIFELHQVVVDVTDKLPENEVWFPEHLYRWTKTLLQSDDGLVTDEELLDLVGRSTLFAKAVIRSVREMYKEKAAALKLLTQDGPAKETSVDDAMPHGGDHEFTRDAQVEETLEQPTITSASGGPDVSKEEAATPAMIPTVDSEGPTMQVMDVPGEAAVKGIDTESSKADSVMAAESESHDTVDEVKDSNPVSKPIVSDRSSLVDSEVEAAIEKVAKKKKKSKKKGTCLVQPTVG